MHGFSTQEILNVPINALQLSPPWTLLSNLPRIYLPENDLVFERPFSGITSSFDTNLLFRNSSRVAPIIVYGPQLLKLQKGLGCEILDEPKLLA